MTLDRLFARGARGGRGGSSSGGGGWVCLTARGEPPSRHREIGKFSAVNTSSSSLARHRRDHV